MSTNPPPMLLSGFPLSRARTVKEACEQVGRTFSPHRLELKRGAEGLDVCHNQVRFRDVSLNTLSYGADVLIDPGQRGDFYMVQLPLSGSGVLLRAGTQIAMDPATLTVLQPRDRCQMLWSSDCCMILVQVPRDVVERWTGEHGAQGRPQFAAVRPRSEPKVACWWQTVLDLTANLDRFGEHWLRYPAAYAAMEQLLLSVFTSMLGEASSPPAASRAGSQSLRRAKEYIHAHLTVALTLPEIARHACVSPRTLEAAFRRNGDPPPLAYARDQRLISVHQAFRAAVAEGRCVNVTEVAMDHGFAHMGRFAAQYRERFGCSPSDTLRPH